jgi:hypothetical protein
MERIGSPTCGISTHLSYLLVLMRVLEFYANNLMFQKRAIKFNVNLPIISIMSKLISSQMRRNLLSENSSKPQIAV